MEAVVFDLDGTLWDSVVPVVDSWNRVLEREYPGLRPPITYEEERGLMGLPMDRLAAGLFPQLEEESCHRVMNSCVKEENRYLEIHGATLFPGIEKMACILSRRYKLMIVSNCQTGYIEAFLHAHHLEKYFCDTQCYGDNHLQKGENIRLVLKRNAIQNAAYVGDTQGDCDAAAAAGVSFIFARYGFGQADRWDAVIDSPEELLSLDILRQ